MHFFEALVAIVAIVMISTVLLSMIKTYSHKSKDNGRALEKRIDRLENRLANLETIVLDKDRFGVFDQMEDRVEDRKIS